MPHPSLISPFIPTHSFVSCCLREEQPHRPRSPEPLPSSGTAILQLQGLPWPSAPQWPHTWSAGTLHLMGTGGTGCAQPSWTPWGCCQLPHPRHWEPPALAGCSELGKPVPQHFSASSRAWSTKPSLCVGDTGSGSHRCLLVAPLLHSLVHLVLVLLGAMVAMAVMAQGCPGVLGAGHSPGESSTSRVQKTGPTTRAPNAREEAGAVQSCPTDTSCISGSIQGKASAQQSTLCVGPVRTSPSPRAGQKQGIIQIGRAHV